MSSPRWACGRKLGNPHFDPCATLVIGVVLVGAALMVARNSRALLKGNSTDTVQRAHLRDVIIADAAVDRSGRLRTVPLGADNLLRTAAVCFERAQATGSGAGDSPARVRDQGTVPCRVATLPRIGNVQGCSASCRIKCSTCVTSGWMVAGSQGNIFVTTEYNRSTPGVKFAGRRMAMMYWVMYGSVPD